MRTLRPTGNRVLVKPLQPQTQTGGGILYAETWQTPSGQAQIIAVGGRVVEETLKPGARVCYNWVAGREVEHDGEMCRLLDVGEVLGVMQ